MTQWSDPDGRLAALLVNSVGLGHKRDFASQPLATVRQMIDVNVRALVELTHAVLPGMQARGRGRVVNVASKATLVKKCIFDEATRGWTGLVSFAGHPDSLRVVLRRLAGGTSERGKGRDGGGPEIGG